jgi:hypothetical protein
VPNSPEPPEKLLEPLLGIGLAAWLRSNLNQETQESFLEDLRPAFHRLVDVALSVPSTMDDTMAALGSIVDTIETWYVSSRLNASPLWQKQMKESEHTSNSVGDAQTVDEIFADIKR